MVGQLIDSMNGPPCSILSMIIIMIKDQLTLCQSRVFNFYRSINVTRIFADDVCYYYTHTPLYHIIITIKIAIKVYWQHMASGSNCFFNFQQKKIQI